jgi:hypothetical protein
MIGPLDQGSQVLAVDVEEVLGLHDKPYPFYGVEVGRVGRKIERFEEVPVEALAFMPGGIIEDEHVPFSRRGDGSGCFIEEGLEDIRVRSGLPR